MKAYALLVATYVDTSFDPHVAILNRTMLLVERL